MKNQTPDIKPIMQIILGLFCLAIFYATIEPLRMEESHGVHARRYSPEDEFFLLSLYWISLVTGIVMIILGLVKVIKSLIRK